jgi:hypothetical protein
MVPEAYLSHKQKHDSPNKLSEKHEKEEEAIKNMQFFPINIVTST